MELRRRIRRGLVAALVGVVAAALVVSAGAAAPRELNGFDLAGALIPTEEILRGGPPRDGIPALDFPPAVPAVESPWSDEELVIGVAVGGAARAYPIGLLVWHELVNDRIGGIPILVSYCPLCGTALVFDRRVAGDERRFGVSGLLYRSDQLMFDRETESLWSQISAEAVTGPSARQRLKLVRSRMQPWGDWRGTHPQTTVLSKQTGHRRSYRDSPYGDYASSNRLLFPVAVDSRYHPKTRTLGLRLPDGTARAYPLDEVRKAGGRVEERLADHPVVVSIDSKSESFAVEAPAVVEVIEGFWFAWAAFHPDSSVFVAR
jgi:hypothetical protein